MTKPREIGIPVYSALTFEEFAATLNRHKFDKYLSVESRQLAIDAFKKKGQIIQVSVSVSVSVCRDPKDNKFLELAAEAGAACIITGDKDLLTLHPFQQIPILTAADFLTTY